MRRGTPTLTPTKTPTPTPTPAPTSPPASANIAPQASVTASSENISTNQQAVKAVDGVIDGYPGDYTKEWATIWGKTGSWLNLTWSNPKNINQIVLYDRPNLDDQITNATIQFNDGSTLPTGVLKNDGSATTINFPTKTITGLKLNITSVSSTTANIGLAEIQVFSTDTVSAPTPTSIPTSIPAKPQRVDPVCISSHIENMNQTDIDTQTTLMQQAGINWVRFDITWANLEQTQGTYNWSNYDYVINSVTSKGMKVLALVTQYGIPEWERKDSSDWMSNPANVQHFGSFVQAFAAHYKGKISLYEIGNEPDLSVFWPPAPDAKAYTQLLIAGYNGVKASDPAAKVISAGLVNGMDTDLSTYIQNMYNNGAKDHSDYFGVHAYTWPYSPDEFSYLGFGMIADIKTLLTNNGDSAKQIVITEVGWPSTTASGGVDEQTQATYINKVYQNIVYNNYQYIPIACIYDFVDDGTDQTDPEQNFGILRNDYSKKPSYSIMQQIRQNYDSNFIPINP